MHKIRSLARRRILPALGLTLAAVQPLLAQTGTTLSGRVSLLDKDNRAATDVDQAVVWLVGAHAPAAAPDTVEMATENKQFVPRLVLLPVGSTIAFPNHDPFNHNVFSLSKEGPFDLGLYGRGEAKSVRFEKTGVIRVYCNVHAQMRGLVLVEETALFTQPGADGTFHLEKVPVGEYTLHVWHERAPEVTRSITVTEATAAPVTVALDARGYRLVQHKDKQGKSYSDRSRRY